MKSKKRRGVLTVEAVIILPIFFLSMAFILNMFNMYYYHLVMQQALQNAGRTMAQYGYVIDELMKAAGTSGLEAFTFQEDTKGKETEIVESANVLITDAKEIGQIFNNLSVDTIVNEIGKNPNIVSKTWGDFETFSKKISDVEKKDLINYLMVSMVGAGGGTVLKLLIGDYLDQMDAETATFQNLKYSLYVEKGTLDFILVADYDYVLPFSFVDNYHMQQYVRVHPWIGGETEGL